MPVPTVALASSSCHGAFVVPATIERPLFPEIEGIAPDTRPYATFALIAVSLLTFLIASLLPGDLAYVILGDQATPEKVAALRHDMGLDQPIWWRYISWLGHVLTGDFGRSFRTGQTVLQAVAERTAAWTEELRDYCRAHLADFKVPANVEPLVGVVEQ